MRWLAALLLLLHGAIHLMGFAKAFGFAKLAQLRQPIGRPLGLLWLGAALVLGLAALQAATLWGDWRLAAGLGLLLSQGVILTSWSDAKAGTVANGLMLLLILLQTR